MKKWTAFWKCYECTGGLVRSTPSGVSSYGIINGQAPLGLEGSGAFRRPGSKGSEGSKGGGGAPLNYRRRPLMIKPLQPPCGRGNAFPLWWLAPPPCRPAGKRVTGFSVAYGSLRIQFPCHRKRGHNKASRFHLFISCSTLSMGCSAPCIGGSPAQPDRGWRAQRASQQNAYYAI